PGEDGGRVGHLRHRPRRDEAAGLDGAQPRLGEAADEFEAHGDGKGPRFGLQTVAGADLADADPGGQIRVREPLRQHRHRAPPERSSARRDSARSNRKTFSSISRSTMISASAALAPTEAARFFACRDMCPRCTPSVASTRRAARFWARPAATMISARSWAVVTSAIRRLARAAGWTLVAPPTRPTGIGISRVPTRSPAALRSNVD